MRQTFLDRATEEPADLRIERINCTEDARRPAPLTSEQIDEGLKSASTLVAGASMLFANWARGFKKHTNTLPMFDPDLSLAAGGDPNIVYYHSHWALSEDEALLIEVMPPQCEHWNFQVNNYWMESLDYRYHTIHTTSNWRNSRKTVRSASWSPTAIRAAELARKRRVMRRAPCVSAGSRRRNTHSRRHGLSGFRSLSPCGTHGLRDAHGLPETQEFRGTLDH